MTDPARSATRSPAPSSPQAGVEPPRRLSLCGDDIDVRTSDHQIGSAMSGGDGAGPIGQQRPAEIGDGGPAPASEKNWFARTRDRLRDRKVPRRTGKGAAAGLVTTGVGGGIAVAAGKGAAIGAAVGSVIPGVGTVGGALIGSLVGAALAAGIGGLIAYAAAGGGSRDKAEQAIDSLRGDGLITAQDAEWLKGQSSAELKALCRIPR